MGLSTTRAEKIYPSGKHYKGEFFIEEPHTRFMPATADLSMTRAGKYTISRKFNHPGRKKIYHRENILTNGNIWPRSRKQGLCGLLRVSRRPWQNEIGKMFWQREVFHRGAAYKDYAGYRKSLDDQRRKNIRSGNCFAKVDFFIDEPHTRFMRAIAGLSTTPAEKNIPSGKKN